MIKLFVTATNTNIGKTYTSIKLLNEFSRRGYKVGVYKPIETDVIDYPKDGKLLLDTAKALNSNFDFTLEEVVPYQFKLPASPFVAKENTLIDKRALYTTLKKLEQKCDVLIIEGAGGLMVPIELDFYMIDLINFFGAKPLLVTSSKLGSINETLLSQALLEQKGIPYHWAVNLHEDIDSFGEVTAPFYRDKFGSFLVIDDDIEKIVNFFV